MSLRHPLPRRSFRLAEVSFRRPAARAPSGHGEGTGQVWRSAAWLAGALLLLAPLEAGGHLPHDPVSFLGLSPSFSVDGTLLVVPELEGTFPNSLPVPQGTTDGGVTWTALPRGLDNLSRFTAVALSPGWAEDGTAFLATEGDGVYRSTDRGSSWSRASGDLPSLAVTELAAAVRADGSLAVWAALAAGGLYGSQDLGESWRRLVPSGAVLSAIAVSPEFAVDPTLFAGTRSGRLVRSVDGGFSWLELELPADAGGVAQIVPVPDFASSGELFVAVERGVARSLDAGDSFVAADAGLPEEPISALAVSPEYATDGTLFAATLTRAVYRSTDRGASWQHLDVGVPLMPQTGTHFRALAVSDGYAADRTLFLAAFEGLFRSTDAGESWVEVETLPPSRATGLAVSPQLGADGTVAVSTYGGGVYVSEDRGGYFRPENFGLGRPTVWDVDAAAGGPGTVLFATHVDHVVRREDPALPWARFSLASLSPDQVFPAVIAASPTIAEDGALFAGAADRDLGLIASDDFGESWRVVAAGFRLASLALSPEFAADGTGFGGTQDGKLLRTMDGGASWVPAGAGLPAVEAPLWVALSPGFPDDGRVVAGTGAGLRVSEDRGDSFAPLTDQAPLAEGAIELVALSPDLAADRTLLASVRGEGLFKSTDGGTTWRAVGGALLAAGHQLLEVRFSAEFAADGTLFGIAPGAIAVSLDRGESWSAEPLPRVRYEATRGNGWHAVRYAGAWEDATDEEASALTYRLTEEPGAEVWLDFSGSGVGWLASRGPALGIAEVWLDDALVAVVDQYAAETSFAVLLFESGDLGPGGHRIRVVATGDRNPASSGAWVTIDAFDVVRGEAVP